MLFLPNEPSLGLRLQVDALPQTGLLPKEKENLRPSSGGSVASGHRAMNNANKWCFNALMASALIFWAGFLQRFAGQNDWPEFGRGGRALINGQSVNLTGGIYGRMNAKTPRRERWRRNSERLRESTWWMLLAEECKTETKKTRFLPNEPNFWTKRIEIQVFMGEHVAREMTTEMSEKSRKKRTQIREPNGPRKRRTPNVGGSRCARMSELCTVGCVVWSLCVTRSSLYFESSDGH
jgi:hypothetical protein